MCSHDRVLADFREGDSVCMECGLVLGRLLGAGSGGPGVISGLERRVPGEWEAAEEESAGKAALGEGYDLISRVLDVLRVDSYAMLCAANTNYRRLYERVRGRGRGHGSLAQRVAVAFGVSNTLARHGAPRPPSYVASLCGVPVRLLLNLPRSLGLSPDDLRELSPEDYELGETTPQEYADAACAQLGIPFHLASEAGAEAERVEWRLHGRHPTVLAAAAMQKMMERRGLSSAESRARVCSLFDCRQRTVDCALRAWPSV